MDIVYYLLTGMVAGVLAGLLGVGGGLIIVPVLLFLFQLQGMDLQWSMHLAVGTSLATIVFTSLSSVYAHHRKQAVLWDVFYRLAPGILVGAFVGAFVAELMPGDILRRFFGLFELAVAIQLTLNIKPKPTRVLPSSKSMIIVGSGIGLVSSIVGIGGGTLTVPFLLWCNTHIKQAVATSAACGLPIAVSGMLGFIVAGWQTQGLPEQTMGFVYWPALLGIVSASIVFAPIGSHLAHKLPASTLKKTFAMMLYGLAIYMII